jgi:hypothetical protein
MWIVIKGRQFPDPEDVIAFGPFMLRADAETFIEEAHDEDSDEPHLYTGDVDYAEVMFVNEVKR